MKYLIIFFYQAHMVWKLKWAIIKIKTDKTTFSIPDMNTCHTCLDMNLSCMYAKGDILQAEQFLIIIGDIVQDEL